MKTAALIAHLLETAGSASRHALLGHLADLMDRLHRSHAAVRAHRLVRRNLRKEIDERERDVWHLKKNLEIMSAKIPAPHENTQRRLDFLESHCANLNTRINAAAEEAYRDGYHKGFNEGMKRLGDDIVIPRPVGRRGDANVKLGDYVMTDVFVGAQRLRARWIVIDTDPFKVQFLGVE